GTSQAASQTLTGTATNPATAVSRAAAGEAPAGPAPGVATVQANVAPALSAAIAPIAQQLNPLSLMTTPQHLYRTWEDIYQKQGPAAMVEAMIPSLVGAGLGYFLTRGSSGTEEGAALGEEAAGFDAAAPTEAANQA